MSAQVAWVQGIAAELEEYKIGQYMCVLLLLVHARGALQVLRCIASLQKLSGFQQSK